MESIDNFKNLEVFKKANEIYELVRKIAELLPEENKDLQFVKELMLSDAMTIVAKIAGAEGGELYDLRMENAAIIRKAARDLHVQIHSLRMFGFEDYHYFQIVRDQIEEFRLLFIDWVESFDQWDYVIDRWGLFNPPGVGPHDIDPDDLIDSQDL